MMKRINRWNVISGALVAIMAATAAVAGVGEPAPAFTLLDTTGATVQLADLKGKVVVLEWINPDCPFVQRHYAAGTMTKLAAEYAGKGVVWLAVNSTHYMDAAASEAYRQKHSVSFPVLVDQDGSVARAYNAATTPHMFIIDREGVLVYAGAIDDDPRGTSGTPVNHVRAALDEVLAGKPVAQAETKPYGCSVKFAK